MERLGRWTVEHSGKIFAVIAVSMAIAAGFAIWQIGRQGEIQHQVDVLRPQVTRVIHRASICAPGTLRRISSRRECARLLEIGFRSCRLYPECRAAVLLAIMTPHSEGVTPQPSRGGQQPTPSKGGGQGQHGQVTPKSPISGPKPSGPSPEAKSPVPPRDIPPDIPSSPEAAKPSPPMPIREAVCGLAPSVPFCPTVK